MPLQTYEVQHFSNCFDAKVAKLTGQAFEDFFNQLMALKHGDRFQPVKACGSLGDDKCDGYLPEEHHVFQAYAPERMHLKEVLGKVERDFAGALPHWPEMKRWTLVHNNFGGLPADVTHLLQRFESEQKTRPIKLSLWSPDCLKELALSLPRESLVTLFGPPPEPKAHHFPCQLLPPQKSDAFIGREEDLKALHKKLRSGENLVVVSGVGGIGKTELTSRYVHQHLGDWGLLHWLEYQSEGIEATLLAHPVYAKVCGEGRFERVQAFLQEAEPQTSQRLVVIDDFKGDDAQARRIAEIFAGSRLMLSSRHSKVAGFESYPLEQLPMKEAKKLFLQHCDREISDADLEGLLKSIDRHTLLTELLAKTFKQVWEHSAPKLKDWIENHQFSEKAFNTAISDLEDEGERSLYGKLARLYEIDPLPEEQKALLARLALLPPHFWEGSFLCDLFTLEPAQLRECLGTLVNRGWLIQEGSRYKCHQIIGFVFDAQPEEGAQEEALLELLDALNRISYDYLEGTGNPIEGAFLVPAFEALLDRAEAAGNLEGLVLAVSYSRLGIFLNRLGRLEGALKARNRNVKLNELAQADDEEIAKALHNRAATLLDLENFGEALKDVEEALSLKENASGPKDPRDLASSHSLLSSIYLDQAKRASGEAQDQLLQQALEAIGQALDLAEEASQQEDPRFYTWLNNRATIYRALEQFEDALADHNKVLDFREQNLTPSNPILAVSYNNRSSVYRDSGKLQEALADALKAAEIAAKVPEYQQRKNHLQGLQISLVEAGYIPFTIEGQPTGACEPLYEEHDWLEEHLASDEARTLWLSFPEGWRIMMNSSLGSEP